MFSYHSYKNSYHSYEKLFAAVFATILLSGLIYGQQSNGSLRGQVSDQQNAVIVGATVEATGQNGKTATIVTDNVLLGVAGARPAQLTIATGNPQAKINQVDFGVFAQDDWRVRPNLTVNLGLRYEAQTNVSNN